MKKRKTISDLFRHKLPAGSILLGDAILKVSENMLAQKLGIKPARLRLWRNEFLNVGRSSGRGKSILYTKQDVFSIMLCVELIRNGASRMDAIRVLENIKETNSNYLYRETVWVVGSDQIQEADWKVSKEIPIFNTKETLSHSVISLDALRAKAEKISR